MSRRCSITGEGVQFGNQVSHSNRKTRKRFLPNMQNVTFYSTILDQFISLRIKVSTLRSIDINGGLDKYLLSTANVKLTPEALALKRRLKKKLSTQAA